MKLFLFFCFAVFFFTGCNKSKSGAKVTGPDSGANKQHSAKNSVSEAVAKEIKMTFDILREASAIHQKMFTLLTESKDQPEDVFRFVGQLLAAEHQAKNPKKTVDSKKKECEVGFPELEFTKEKKHRLLFHPCRGPKAKAPVAVFFVNGKGNVELHFNLNLLLQEPHNIYGYNSVWHLRQDKIQSKCEVAFNLKSGYMDSYHCINLAHDFKDINEVEATKAVFFESIDYNRERERPLMVKGFFLDRRTNPATKTKVIAEDDPKLNHFNVGIYPESTSEEGIFKDKDASADKGSDAAPAAATATATEGQDPSPKAAHPEAAPGAAGREAIPTEEESMEGSETIPSDDAGQRPDVMT